MVSRAGSAQLQYSGLIVVRLLIEQSNDFNELEISLKTNKTKEKKMWVTKYWKFFILNLIGIRCITAILPCKASGFAAEFFAEGHMQL